MQNMGNSKGRAVYEANLPDDFRYYSLQHTLVYVFPTVGNGHVTVNQIQNQEIILTGKRYLTILYRLPVPNRKGPEFDTGKW